MLIGSLLFFTAIFLGLAAFGAIPVRSGGVSKDSQNQPKSVVQPGAIAKRLMKGYRSGGASKNTIPGPNSGGAPANSNATVLTPSPKSGQVRTAEHRNALGQTVYTVSPSGFDISPPLSKLAKVSLPEAVEEQRPELELPSWRVPRSGRPDPVTQVAPASRDLAGPLAPAAPTTGFNFEAVAGTSGFPPDNNGSVGNDQYVETVNTRTRSGRSTARPKPPPRSLVRSRSTPSGPALADLARHRIPVTPSCSTTK